MNNFAIEIWDDTSSRVTYYSVRKADSKNMEVDKFYDKFESDDENVEHLKIINTLLLEHIGENRGAEIELFNRQENSATALPPAGRIAHEVGFDSKDFPLRLYCLRLTENIVILFNGGLKTSQTAQGSPGVSMAMKEADSFARKILAEWNKTILLDDTGTRLVNDEGTEDLFIY